MTDHGAALYVDDKLSESCDLIQRLSMTAIGVMDAASVCLEKALLNEM